MESESAFLMLLRIRNAKHSEIAAYRDDGQRGGREAQWAGPLAGQRGPGAVAGLAAEGLAWLQKNQAGDSGARLCDLYLLI